MSAENITVEQTTEEMNCIFIHSALDDANLTPHEFRVYAHLARRASSGSCYAAKTSMAKICGICEDKIRECLNTLVARCMISRETRKGMSAIYKILKRSCWRDLPCANSAPHHAPIAHPPCANSAPKVIPDKIIQKEGKECADAPPSLDLDSKVLKAEPEKAETFGALPPVSPDERECVPKPVQPQVALVDAYVDVYEDMIGEPYIITKGRDYKAGMEMHRQGVTVDDIKRKSAIALAWPDKFLSEQARTFHSFCANFNRYVTAAAVSGARAKAKEEKDYSAWEEKPKAQDPWTPEQQAELDESMRKIEENGKKRMAKQRGSL